MTKEAKTKTNKASAKWAVLSKKHKKMAVDRFFRNAALKANDAWFEAKMREYLPANLSLSL